MATLFVALSAFVFSTKFLLSDCVHRVEMHVNASKRWVLLASALATLLLALSAFVFLLNCAFRLRSSRRESPGNFARDVGCCRYKPVLGDRPGPLVAAVACVRLAVYPFRVHAVDERGSVAPSGSRAAEGRSAAPSCCISTASVNEGGT